MSVARTLRYDPLHSRLGHLAITAVVKGKPETANYLVTVTTGDTFEVARLANEIKPGEPDGYRVCIRPGSEACPCKGHEHRRGGKFCRHVAALTRLRQLGRV